MYPSLIKKQSLLQGAFTSHSPNPEDKYRFYTCELKPSHWECQKGFHEMKDKCVVTQVVPVRSWIPTFLDAGIISYTLKKGVVIRPDPNLYIRTSWEGAVEQKAEGSSE